MSDDPAQESHPVRDVMKSALRIDFLVLKKNATSSILAVCRSMRRHPREWIGVILIPIATLSYAKLADDHIGRLNATTAKIEYEIQQALHGMGYPQDHGIPEVIAPDLHEYLEPLDSSYSIFAPILNDARARIRIRKYDDTSLSLFEQALNTMKSPERDLVDWRALAAARNARQTDQFAVAGALYVRAFRNVSD